MASRPRRLLGDGGELLRKAELAELAVVAGLARLYRSIHMQPVFFS